MKKLLQIILATAMVISCIGFVACSVEEECQHVYAETVVAATCTTGGYTEHKCSKCGDTYKDNEVAALGHDLTDWAEQTAATCTTAQVMERHCQRTGCEYSETQDGEAKLGHNVVWTTVREATCTESGLKSGACERCDYTEQDQTIDKLGHHYVEVSDDEKAKAATCTEDGLKVEICDRAGCGDRKETPLLALGHEDDGTKEVVVAPTCTEQGYTTRHCSRCNTDYNDNLENALGHDMEKTQTAEVTCLNDGYELWSCKRDGCDYTEKKDEEPKLDHAFNDKGECTNGCGKTINDKITWVNTAYSVTYNEAKDKLTMDGGDPGIDQIQQKVKIPAELFANMKNEGKAQFSVIMYKWNGTTTQFGLNFNTEGAQSDWKYSENNVDSYTSGIITITDEMLTDGFEFWALYCDLTQRNPAWGATVKCTGFDFDIEFIKPFDINDKSMWVRSDFAGTEYSAEKAKWVISDAAPGKGDVQKNVTISADVFKAMNGTYGLFKIKLTTKDTGTAPIFGFKDATTGGYLYGNNSYTTAEKTITEDMSANGYTFTVLYADDYKRNDVEAPDVTGFDMDIEFIKGFDINDKTTWFTSDFDACTITDAGVFNFTGAGSAIKLSLKKEVIAAMVADNKTSIKFTFSRLNENEDTAYIISGYDELPGRKNGAWEYTFTFNDDMKANGINLTLNIFSCGWGGTWVAPTGVALTLAFA